MKRSLFALFGGLSLIGSAALAQHAGGGAMPSDQPQAQKEPAKGTSDEIGAKGAKADEPKKHLGEIDVYLKDALNNTKVLYATTQLQPGKLDPTIQREDLGNIDRAITGAMTHVSHVKSMPEARVVDMAKIDSLQKNLTRARALVGQLRTAVRSDEKDQISSLTSQLYARLREADDDFGTVADKQDLTRVDRIMVPEKQPVGGQEEGAPPPSGAIGQPPPAEKANPSGKPEQPPPEKN